MGSIRCYHNMVFGLLSLESSGRVFRNTYIVGHEHDRWMILKAVSESRVVKFSYFYYFGDVEIDEKCVATRSIHVYADMCIWKA